MFTQYPPLRAVVLVLVCAVFAPPSRAEPLPGGTLDPTTIPKYVEPLVIPPAMPQSPRPNQGKGNRTEYYDIAVRQFEQQILPCDAPAGQSACSFPKTKVWSYGSPAVPATFHYPAFTIEAKYNTPVRVRWVNDLKDAVTGNFLSHLVPIDPTLHWANPPGGLKGRDSRPVFAATPTAYDGPVPISVHLHGGHVPEWADGFPEAWFLPAANDIPAGYATEGTHYAGFKAAAEKYLGCPKDRSDPWACWDRGAAVFEYDNIQDAATLWYHDHTLGMTRANVYAGPAGFYLLRGGPSDTVGGVLPGPAPALGDAPGTSYYEIPIAIQDRSFDDDGVLFYPGSREFFDGFAGPFVPEVLAGAGKGAIRSDVSPLWNPEFFGNTMVVNGKTWPYLEVEARRYRFRFLNGSDSRFLILRTDYAGLTFWQIGADGGFLPAPVEQTELLLGPAERADVIVDFTDVPPNTEITLLNVGPDEPFGGGVPGEDFEPSDPGTTGQVMQFRVVPSSSSTTDPSTPPSQLTLPAKRVLPTHSLVRQVSLNELDSATVCLDAEGAGVACGTSESTEPFGPLEAMLGTVMFDAAGMPMGMPMMWDERITENPKLGATEIWEIYNFTMDAHPIHLHEIMFEVVDREPFMDMESGMATMGDPRPPEPWESGFKDTVIAYPGEITRVKATFDRAGLYVWHCHILSHEDNEMMRPYRIGN